MEYIIADVTVRLGATGDNLATTVKFPVADIVATYGSGGTFALLNRRPLDDSAYTVPASQVTTDGGYVSWTVKTYDVAQAGYGECQLSYTVGETVKMTQRWRTYTAASLVDGGGGDMQLYRHTVQFNMHGDGSFDAAGCLQFVSSDSTAVTTSNWSTVLLGKTLMASGKCYTPDMDDYGVLTRFILREEVDPEMPTITYVRFDIVFDGHDGYVDTEFVETSLEAGDLTVNSITDTVDEI